MHVRFRTKKLERCFEQIKQATRIMGPEVGRRYVQRVKIIFASRDIDELRTLPGLRCHALKGNREGQWAVTLAGFYRLIITLEGNGEIVCIEEVSKHYGD